jgi:large repetitive protein
MGVSTTPTVASTVRTTRRRRRAVGWQYRLALMGAAAIVVVPLVSQHNVAQAASSWTVTTQNDGVDSNVGDNVCATGAGQCTLRAAIQEANATGAADTVIVPAGTYTITIAPSGDNGADNGDFDITRPLTITGTGPAATVIDAGTAPGGSPPEQLGLDRLIEISETGGNVTLRNLTLREGYDSNEGGALLNASAATVKLDNVRVMDSYATAFGGGISHIGGGRLELTNTTVSGNDTVGEGGGIHVASGSLKISGTASAPSVIAGNTAREGGGIYHGGEDSPAGLPSSVTLTGVTIQGNTAQGLGGGASITGDNGLSMSDTVFAENTAEEGGGLAITGGTGLSATRGSFEGNVAHGNGGGAFTGSERAVKFTDVVFEANTAGDPVSGDGGGAGLSAEGTASVTISGGSFLDNEAISTGGGLSMGASGSVTGVEFRGNHSDAGGGGAVNHGDMVTFTEVTMVGNTTSGIGGGLLGEGSGDFNMIRSSIHGNTAVSGGGFANEADGQTYITETTFWANRAVAGSVVEDAGLGGGVFSLGDASATYENVTINGNFAQMVAGGFYVDADAPVRLVNTTITGNTSPVAAGVGTEIAVQPIPPEPSQGVIFRNSIVAGNLQSEQCNFAVGSEGGNLDSGDSCYFRGVQDRVNIGDPKLDAPADNGGAVMTQAIWEDSYALDGGISPCPLIDAVGTSRPQNGRCDIGAFEHTGPFSGEDTVAPTVQILTLPTTVGEMYEFEFTGTDNQTPTNELLYECRFRDPAEPIDPLDPDFFFLGCPATFLKMDIEEGTNLLEVRSIDRKGNRSELATHTFTGGVDVTAPLVEWNLLPSDPSEGRTAVFGFEKEDPGTPEILWPLLESECRLDSTDELAWVECGSPHSVSDLNPGEHTLEVRVTDEFDNFTIISHTWDVLPPSNCSAANVTLVADADSYVDESLTLENFGADDNLEVRSSAPGMDARTLVRFPVPRLVSAGGSIPNSCSLVTAKLKLTGDGDPDRTLEAVPIAGSWLESQVTWQNQPPTGGTAAVTESGAGQRVWDLTAQVGALVSGGTNNGFMIRDAVEEDEGFGSSFSSRHMELDPTAPSMLPQLELRFGGPAEQPAPYPASATTETPAALLDCSQGPVYVDESIKLGADMINCVTDAIVVTSPNVEIDLNGHMIDGPGYFPGEPGSPIELPEIGGPAGVFNPGFANVHVVDRTTTDVLADGKTDGADCVAPRGTIKQFMFGVRYAAGSRFGSVSDIAIQRNALAGMELFNADNGHSGNDVTGVCFTDNEIGLSLMGGTERTEIVDNYFQGNLGVAMWLQEGGHNTIDANRITGVTSDPLLSSDGGVLVWASTHNAFTDNWVWDTGDGGLVIEEGSHNFTITGNTFSRAGDAGIVSSGSDFLTIQGNYSYQGSDAGVSVSDSHGTAIRGNDLRFNPGGVEISDVHDTVVELNDASDAGGNGIELGGDSTGVTIRDNIASRTSAGGISIDVEGLDPDGLPFADIVVERNTTNDNLGDGIEVTRGGHTLQDNDAHNNAAFGIQAAELTIDGGDNRASGNGEPPQCEGVVCGPPSAPVPPAGQDIQNPDTEILTSPGTTSSTMAVNTFTFRGWDVIPAPTTEEARDRESAKLRFECRLDAPPDPPAPEPEPGEPQQPPDVDNWIECHNPVAYHYLPPGPHKFEVRAVDSFDNVDLTPAVWQWNVVEAPPGPDTRPPNTRISAAPVDNSSDTTVTFNFRGTDDKTPGPYMTYQCRLDGGAWTACSPGHSYSNLSLTQHTFEVRAIDLSGNIDQTPAQHVWTVIEPPVDDIPPDTFIVSGPDPTTVSTSAEFVFAAGEPNTTFQCRLNSNLESAYAACTSPHTVAGLAVQTHTFDVRAVDSVGNPDPFPASFVWTVGPPPIPMAVNCGQVITQSIMVTEDLLDCASDGLIIGANSITLDLGGAMIDGIGQGVGIRNDGYDSVTITNGTVQQFDIGVALNSGTSRGIVSGITAQLNQEVGLALSDADNGSTGSTVRSNLVAGNSYGIRVADGTSGALLSDNTVGGTAENAISVINSDSNRIERNTVSSTSGMGIYIEGSGNTNIVGNTVSGTSKQAVSLQAGSHGNVVEGNALGDSEIGVEILESDDNQVIGNDATDMHGPGIALDTTSNNRVIGNDVSANENGIELYMATGNHVEGNNASGNSSTGIAVGDGSVGNEIALNTAGQNDSDGIQVEAEALGAVVGNMLRQNNTSGNSSDGIAVNKEGHTITANIANNNGGWGMYANPGNTDGGINRASGNTELEQCFNIVCDGSAPRPPEVDPPNTVLSSGPTTEFSTSATFTFYGIDDNTPVDLLEFQCRLDSTDEADFVDCESPHTYTNLAAGPHSFEVRAVDLAEKVDPTPAVFNWMITPPGVGVLPDTQITTTVPDSPIDWVSIAFQSVNEPDSTFQCSLDGAAYSACVSPVLLEELQYGPHQFRVRAVDPEGYIDSSPAIEEWVRIGPPVVTIGSGPAEITTSRRAEFTFTANEVVTGFECSLDLAPYAACTSPTEYLNLAIGEHYLRVRATDPDGNTSGENELAEYEWTIEPSVDTVPPNTAFLSVPGSPSASSTFEFTGTDDVTAPAGLIFECRLDSTLEADFAECTSPWTYPNPDFPEPLQAGVNHTVDVRAVDMEDNIDPTPVSHTWLYLGDTVAPTVQLLATPPATTPSQLATFVFSANDPFAAFECALDGGTTPVYESCSTPHEVSSLEPGVHTMHIRATDLTGNVGAAVVTTWEVIAAPVVQLLSTPPVTVASPLATFTFSASQPGATFTCALDGAAYTPCTSPVNLTGLAVGLHSFSIQATAAGAVGEPVHYQWTVAPPPDTVAPETTIVTGPASPTSDTTATLTFTSSEAGSTFACSLDGAAYTACTSPREYTGLSVGSHEVRVAATDTAGNLDTSAAVHTWTIEEEAPPPPVCTSGPITLGSGRDSWVLQGSSSNYGTDSILKVAGKTGNNSRALVRFELPTLPVGCQIATATLRMYAGSHATGRTLQALRVNANWTESGVTWSNQPATTGTAVTTASGSGWRQWTVTDMVNAQYAGTNHGFLIRDSVESGGGAEQSLHSREKAPDNPPQLVLTLGSATPPGGGDTTPPQTVIDTGPSGSTASSSATITFSADEAGSTFACSLDNAAYAACTSPVNLTGLATGAHEFRVAATDPSGNLDLTPAGINWTVTSTCSGPSTVTVGSAADSWVLQSSASSNYGTDSVVKVDSKSGNNARALFRFTLPTIPAGCSVTSANLRLYAGSYKTGRTLQALQITSAWTEGNVRWDNQPGTAALAATAASGAGYRQWSVAQQVAAMYAGANHGFLIRDAAESGGGNEQGFHSREKGTDSPPQLVITFG